MSNEKIIFFLAIVMVVTGCVGESSVAPPSINKESVYFENQYYSLYYPKGWMDKPVSENDSDHLFGDWNYRKYSFIIRIINDEDFSASNYMDSGIVKKGEESLGKAGFTNISFQFKDIVFDGKRGQEYIHVGRNSKEYREIHVIYVRIDSKKVGSVFFSYWYDFNEDIRQRMSEVLSSIHFK